MKKVLETIDGYKIYGLCALAIVVTIVNHFVPLPYVNLDPSNWLNDIWGQLVLVGFRSTANKLT